MNQCHLPSLSFLGLQFPPTLKQKVTEGCSANMSVLALLKYNKSSLSQLDLL